MSAFRVGIAGCGTVGSGVVELLLKNGSEIEKKTGKKIEISFVADPVVERIKKFGISEDKIFKDGLEAIKKKKVDAVVELIGGKTVAKQLAEETLKRGIHLVTANKALLADHGKELFELARENNCVVKFEASVGGGIPVIKVLREGLVGNKIERIYGIINGTANFILSKMTQSGITFDEALREAQANGYAESDPSLDIDGYDSAHKIAVLSSIAFCRWVKTENVYVKGIREITPLDIEFAEEFGYSIKLLAISKLEGDALEVRVHPTMIPKRHILSSVSGVFNACLIYGDFVGEVLLYGKGAGKNPTASAVVSDIVDLASGNLSTFPDCLGKDDKYKIKEPDEFVSSFYLRFSAVDKPGVLAKVSKILGEHNISIKMALQKGISISGAVPIVMTTHPARKKDIHSAVKKIDSLDVITEPTFVCMIEEL